MPKYELPEELTPVVNYIAQTNQSVFSYKFYVVDAGDLFVYINGIELSRNAYSVSGVGNSAGGFVTINSSVSLVQGDLVTLSRFTLPQQLTQFLRTGDFTADAVNAEFNRLYALMQEQRRDFFQLVDVVETQGEQVEKNKSDITSLNQRLLTEEQTRATADANLQSQITKEVVDRKAAVSAEATARAAGDANLQAQITGDAPLESSAFSPISWHKQLIENSVTIPPNVNAWSFGPVMEIAEGQVVTISEGSTWTIANGKVEE